MKRNSSGRGSRWKWAGLAAAAAIICLWTVIDNWLDTLHGQWDARFLAAVAALCALTWAGDRCGAAWRKTAGVSAGGEPRGPSAGMAILAGVFLLVFVCTLVPDLLTRKVHPEVASAALAAGWHAACVAGLALVAVGLARREIDGVAG